MAKPAWQIDRTLNKAGEWLYNDPETKKIYADRVKASTNALNLADNNIKSQGWGTAGEIIAHPLNIVPAGIIGRVSTAGKLSKESLKAAVKSIPAGAGIGAGYTASIYGGDPNMTDEEKRNAVILGAGLGGAFNAALSPFIKRVAADNAAKAKLLDELKARGIIKDGGQKLPEPAPLPAKQATREQMIAALERHSANAGVPADNARAIAPASADSGLPRSLSVARNDGGAVGRKASVTAKNDSGAVLPTNNGIDLDGMGIGGRNGAKNNETTPLALNGDGVEALRGKKTSKGAKNNAAEAALNHEPARAEPRSCGIKSRRWSKKRF